MDKGHKVGKTDELVVYIERSWGDESTAYRGYYSTVKMVRKPWKLLDGVS